MSEVVISPLTNLMLYTNNYTKRTKKIRIITPHCTAGSVDGLRQAEIFCQPTRKASANYIIGRSGELVCNVDETKRAWTTSSAWNDHMAITIECSSKAKDPYQFDANVYDVLIELCVDICKRYGYKALVYPGSKENLTKMLENPAFDDQCLLSLHRWFAAKACPGQWFVDKLPDFVNRVNEELGEESGQTEKKLYRVQVGAYSVKQNAELVKDKLNTLGFDAVIV